MKKFSPILILLFLTSFVKAQYLEVSRSATLKHAPDINAQIVISLEKGNFLWLLDEGEQTQGYYHVRVPGSYQQGYIYRSLVRRYEGQIPEEVSTSTSEVISDNYLPPLPPSFVSYSGAKENCIIMENFAFTSCMDTTINLPLWVSHSINGELIRAGEIARDRPNSYGRDNKYSRLPMNAYSKTGYDHGHLAPARDFKWDSRAWFESFYMTNMSPQYACMNQKCWCHLESHCRQWALGTENTLYIVSGIIPGEYIDTLCLKNMKVCVPERFFKVVLSLNQQGGPSSAIGFIIPNSDVSNAEIPGMSVPIDMVESLTQLDFFSFLPDDLESTLESAISVFPWWDTLDCPDRDCERIYSGNRTRPETRTESICE